MILTDSDGSTVQIAIADIDSNTTNASLTEDGTNLILTDSDGSTVQILLSNIQDGTGTDNQNSEEVALTTTTDIDGSGANEVNVQEAIDALNNKINASNNADTDPIVGNEVVGPTDTTLRLDGAGTTASPYTLDVRDSGITSTEIANDAVTSAKIDDNTIEAIDINTGAVTSNEILDGTVATTDIQAGPNSTVLFTDNTGTVRWQNEAALDNQVAAEVGVGPPNDVDGDGVTENNVQEVINSIAPITAKAARIFYPPSIEVDVSANTTYTIDLHAQYIAQYGSPIRASAGAPGIIPTYIATDLYYYVTYADPTVFDTGSMTITNDGKLTYTVLAQPTDYNTLINVVFVVK